MRIKQKLFVILFTLFICQNPLAAFSNFNTIPVDTIPEVVKVYTGNRIMVKSIKVNKRKGQSVKITFNLVNTGRNKVKLGKKRVVPSDLIIEFDSSLEKNELANAKASIIESIKNQDISIRPGQLIMGEKLKFLNRPIPPSDRIAEKEKVDEVKIDEVNEVEIIEEIITETVEDIVETPVKESPMEETKEIMESEVIETPEEIDETILVKTSPSKKIESQSTEIAVKEETIEEVEEAIIETPTEEIVKVATIETPINEVIEVPVPIIELPVEEVIEENNLETPTEEIVDDTAIETTVNEVTKETIVETPVKEVGEEIETPSSNQPTERQCPDLAVVNVEIVKKNKRNVTLKFTVSNMGNIPIALLGDTKKEEDNISIQVYFTRSEKLTRGAIPVKSFYIKKGLKGKGLLEPNATYSGKIKVETSKMTKFTPVVAFSIDPNQDTPECTRINNVSFVNITENAAPKSDNPLPIQPLEANEDEVIGSNEMRN